MQYTIARNKRELLAIYNPPQQTMDTFSHHIPLLYPRRLQRQKFIADEKPYNSGLDTTTSYRLLKISVLVLTLLAIMLAI